MRIALFGGTFDPIHWGHLLLAESARASHHLDRILFIPAGIPPHKSPPQVSAPHRFAMVCRAIASNPSFEASDWEIRQQRAVYAFETIAHFRRLWPRHKLFFIVGSDSLQQIDRWRMGRSLLDQCVFLVAERPGTPPSALAPVLRREARRIPGPAIPLSSHEIRARVRQGKSIRYQVLEPVERYIRRKRLYKK